MKKYTIIVGIVSLIFCCIISGCSNGSVSEESDICAYIKSFDKNKVICEEVEYVTREDTKRVKELGLEESDMPNGYYINESNSKENEYIITDSTQYNIIDWHNQFVEKGADREYSTSKFEDFETYMGSYENSLPGMPFFIKVKDGKVISITEKMMP